MMRSRTIILLVVFLIYVIVGFFVRHNQGLLLIAGVLFAVTSGVLRDFILVKEDKPDSKINIAARNTKINVDDSKITLEDTEKSKDAAKPSN